jgi:FMRP KH0 domain
MESAHSEFLKVIKAVSVRFIAEQGVLRVISRNDSSQRLSSMVQEMHFRNLSQRVLLLRRMEESARQLASTKQHEKAMYQFQTFFKFFFTQNWKMEFVLDPTPTDTMKSST